MPPRRRFSFIISVLIAAGVSSASARQWRTTAGQTFEAEFVSVEGDNAVLSANGKQYRFPISGLSVSDRLFVNKTAYSMSKGGVTTTPSPAATAGLATPTVAPTAISTALQLA